MAVQSIRLLPARKGNYGMTLQHERTLDWICISDSRNETDYTICQYGWSNNILPIPYTTIIPGVLPLIGLLCRKLTIDQDKKAPLVYWISAEYSSAPLSISQQQQPENPLDIPAKYVWRTNRYTKTIYADINEDAVVNSAGEYFDPPAEVEYFYWTCGVTKNVAGIPSWLLSLAEGGPVNDAAFTIQGINVGVGIGRIVEMNIAEQQSALVNNAVVWYFPFSYSIEFRENGWYLSLLDQGLRELDPDDATKRIPIQDDGVPPKDIRKPVPLDGAGHELEDPTPATCHALDFEYCFPFDFNSLPGIGSSRAKGSGYIVPDKDGEFPEPTEAPRPAPPPRRPGHPKRTRPAE